MTSSNLTRRRFTTTTALRGLTAFAAVAAFRPGAALAQAFKAPIRIVVPAAPGGGTDIVARLVAPTLSRELGQNVVIENRPGASGQLGAQAVQAAAPDGATILCSVDHGLIVVPLTTPTARYDAEADFVALGQSARTFWALLLPPGVPYRNLQEYLQALQREPRLRSYGVPLVGGATQLVADAIGKAAGVEMTPVPFQGSAPVLQNVMAGQVPAGITGMPEAVSAMRSGKARVMAVSGGERTKLLPDVPTFKELGVPGLEFHTFVGFFAPKGLPPAMAQAFNAALRSAMADATVQEKLMGTGMQPVSTTLEEASREVSDIERFWKAALAPKR